MKETMLAAIFVVHAIAFAYFWLTRGRRVFYCLFCGGFILLTGYYAYNSWQFFAGVESRPAWLHYFRWAGLILCALATPFFLMHLFRRRRQKSVWSGRC
jgi:TRAP-type C4-dicarboxylate transport system permease small subunit